MATTASQGPDLFALLVYLIGVLGVVFIMLGLSYFLGQRHSDRQTNEPYESGVKTTGSARMRFSAKFYLVAMLFVIFDLEVVFLFGWAIAARQLGWGAYFGLLAFVGILIVGLIYEWRMGALDWLSAEFKALRSEREKAS